MINAFKYKKNIYYKLGIIVKYLLHTRMRNAEYKYQLLCRHECIQSGVRTFYTYLLLFYQRICLKLYLPKVIYSCLFFSDNTFMFCSVYDRGLYFYGRCFRHATEIATCVTTQHMLHHRPFGYLPLNICSLWEVVITKTLPKAVVPQKQMVFLDIELYL